MKLHLPKPLRNSVLACIAAVAGIATPTLGTATFVGGVVAFTLASHQAAAANQTLLENTTWNAENTTTAGSSDKIYVGGEDQNRDILLTIEDGANIEAGWLVLRRGGDVTMTGGNLQLERLHVHNYNHGGATEVFTLSGGTVLVTATDDFNNTQTGERAAVTIGHWGNGGGTVIVSGGTFTVASGSIYMGHDSRAQLQITGGTVNTKGLYYSAQNVESELRITDGRLNIGTGGINNTRSASTKVSLLGGTVGALSTEGWTLSGVTTTIGEVTIDTNVWNAEANTSTNNGAAITLLGSAQAAEGGAIITLAGSGALKLSKDIANNVQLNKAADASATLTLVDCVLTDLGYVNDGNFGDTGKSGFLSGYHVLAEGSTVKSVAIGESTYTLTNGYISAANSQGAMSDDMLSVFEVRDNVTYDAASMSGATAFNILQGGVLTVDSATSTFAPVTNAGQLVLDYGSADISSLKEILDKTDGVYGSARNESTGVIVLENDGNKILGGNMTLAMGGTLIFKGGTLGTSEGTIDDYLFNENDTTIVFEDIEAYFKGSDQQVKGTVVLRGDTTVHLRANDIFQYGASRTIEEGAVLDVGATRQSLSGASALTLDGGKVYGTGGSYREGDISYVAGLDFYGNGTIRVTEDSLIATGIASRYGTTEVTYNVSSGKTLEIGTYGEGENQVSGNLVGSGRHQLQGGGTMNILVDATPRILAVDRGVMNIGLAGQAVNITASQLELGDNGDGAASTLNVNAGSTLVVTGSDTTGDDAYKTTGFIMSEWHSESTMNIYGKIVAENASVKHGDWSGYVNLKDGGLLATKGIGNMKNQSTMHLNMEAGSTLILGQAGIDVHQLNSNLKGGTIGISAEEVLIAENLTIAADKGLVLDTTLYEFNEEGTDVTKGTTGGKLTISGSVSGSGKLVKAGAGTLDLTGGVDFTGSLDVQAGAMTIASGTLNLTGTIANKGNLTISGTIAADNLYEFDIDGGTYSYSDGIHGFLAGSVNYVIIDNEGTLDISGATLDGVLKGQKLKNGIYAATVNDSANYYVNLGTNDATSTKVAVNLGAGKNYLMNGGILVIDSTSIAGVAQNEGEDAAAFEQRKQELAGSILSSTVGSKGTVKVSTNARFSAVTMDCGADLVVSGSSSAVTQLTVGTAMNSASSIASFKSVTLDYGKINFNAAPTSLSNLAVTANGGAIHFNDYRDNPNRASATLFSGDTSLTGDLTISSGYKYAIEFEHLTGSGDMLLSAGASNPKSLVYVDSLAGYEGAIHVNNRNVLLYIEDEAWTGNVVYSGAARGNHISQQVNAIRNNLTLANAVYGISGAAGYIDEALTVDVSLVNPTGGYALTVVNGDSNSHNHIRGKVTGTGDFVFNPNYYDAWDWSSVTYEFSGDLSQWSGNIIFANVQAHNEEATKDLTIKLSGNATDVAANVVNNNAVDTAHGISAVQTNDKLILLIENDKDVTLRGKIDVDDLRVSNTGVTKFTNTVATSNLTLAATGGLVLGTQASLAVSNAAGITIGTDQSLATEGAATLDSALTFNGGSLTLGSALNLGDNALTLSATNKTALTLADGMVGENVTMVNLFTHVTDVLGITGITTGVKLDSVFDVDASLADLYLKYNASEKVLMLTSIIAENREWTQKDGVNAGTWAEGYAFGATGATDAPVFAENDYAVFGSLAADHTVTIGAPLDTAQGTAARVDAGSLTVNAGAGKKYTFTGGEIHTPLLTITSGTAEFTANTLQLSELGEESISIAKDGVLDLSAYEVSIFQQMYTKATGEGAIVLDEGQVMLTGDLSIDINTQIDGDELRLNANDASQNAVVTLNKALSYTDETNSFLRLESGAKLLVADNGVLEVSKVELGHDKTAGNVGHLEIGTGGSVTAGSVAITTGSGGGTLVVNGGTLELTGEGGIASGIATSVVSGELKATVVDWTMNGGIIGGWDATAGAPKVSITGTKTITLNDSTLTSTLNNTGSLNLAGTINIRNTEAAAFQTTKNGADWFSTTKDANGNGFRFATLDYTIATGTGMVTAADNLKWTLNGTELKDTQYKLNLNTAVEGSTDNVTTISIMGQRQDTLYWVNNNTVTYDGTTPADGETHATGYALNGGILQLNKSLASTLGITKESKPGTINLNGTGVTLTAAQVTGTGSAALTGNGVYDLGTVTNLGTAITEQNALKVSFGNTWTGTVKLGGTVAGAVLKQLGKAGSTVEIAGLSGYLSPDNNEVCDVNLKLTGEGLTITENTEAKEYQFSGAVGGTGNFTFNDADNAAATYTFTGDVSGWEGAFVVTAANTAETGQVNVKFSGSNTINAAITENAGALNVYVDDAHINKDDKTVAVNETISATKLTLGLADDTDATDTAAATRATVALKKTVTVDTLINYAVTTVNGTLADGAAVTNDGTLSLTQDAATLASLAGTGSVTAKSLTLTGAATDSNDITADSLTLQGATNTVGALTLNTLTLGANVTSLTAGELKISGDVVVSKVAANFLLKSSGLAKGSELNLNIAEDVLQDYMSAANATSVKLAEVAGLERGQVTLNKDTKGWSAEDHTLTTSDDQYTYTLNVDAGVLTLTRATNGIIWNGDDGEKWVMDDDTVSWKTKGENPDDKTYGTVAQSTIFNGDGESKVVVSGAVTTTNVTFDVTDADIDGYIFTDDDDTTDPDSLTIEKNLSINGGELKIKVSTNVGGRTEVGQDGKLTLAMPRTEQNPYMVIGTGLINHGAVTVSEGTVVNVGDSTEQEPDYSSYITNNGKMTVEGTLGVVGTATNAQQASLEVSKTGTVTAVSVSNAGKISSEGVVQTQSMQNDETGVLEFTSGKAYIGANPTATNLSNAGEITVSGASVAVIGGVDNDGDLYVTGGSLNTGNVDNDGTLSVAGGSMTVTGNLDNTDGYIIIGTAAVADKPETDEDDTQAATNGTLSVKGNLIHAGDRDIVVNSGSSLGVSGDLKADGMKLGFDGSVTVGGTATLKDLTIAEKATFTAENATITGVLDNDGLLTVTTTEVKDENGIPVLDKDNNKTYTGGQLSIGTLTGAGEVHVEEGGTLSIGSSVNFTGTLTGEGKLTTGNQAFTLSTKQDEVKDVALATDISAQSLVVAGGQWMKDGEVVAEGTEGATWASANGSILGEVATDSITFTKLDTTGIKHLTMESLQAYSTPTASGAAPVEVALSQLDTEEGVAELIKTGVHTYNLLSYVGGTVNLTLADMAYDREQQLWKSGLKLGELTSVTTMALRAAGTNVSISVLNQSLADATWNTAGETTGIGLDLGTLTNGTMVLKGNDMLDKVQSVNVTKDVTLDLSSTDTNAVKVNGLTGGKTLNIAGNGDVVNVSTVAGGFGGTLGLDNVQATVSGKLETVKLTNKTVADLAVTDTDVEALTSGLTLNGSMKGGELSISKAAGVKGTLKIDGTNLNIAYDDKGELTMSTANVATTGQVLVNMDKTTGEAGDIFIGKDGVASKLMEKYYANVRFEDKKGVVADRNTVYYTSKLTDSASTDNGKAGLAMADEALLSYNPQNSNATGDLAAVLDQLDEYVATGNKAAADELGASLAGASTAVLGMAAMGDVDRQLRAIRNRTTTMGVDQSVVNADMPYFNAWINAEGDSREMGEDGTLGGYKLNSYGGTVGFDVDIEPTLTAGMALTAMYGDLDATGADKATGNLDSYYVSAFARYCGSAWTHTFVGTIGMGDISLDRTVGSAQVKGETDSMSFGLMYEVGRVYAMDEDGTTCLQPVFNVTWKHTTVDAYTEKGGDVALSVDEQSLDTITFGLGARLQTVVGESMYNRTSIFECRLLAKADAGDTEGTSKVALGSSATHEVKSNEMGAIGIEVGAGLTIPLGDEGSSIFMDASAEIRADYTDVNGTVGYRVNF